MRLHVAHLFPLFAFVTGDRAIPRPQNFYGSEALLDGYCDEAEHFIDVFTLPSERLTVEGSASDVTRALMATTDTGKQDSIITVVVKVERNVMPCLKQCALRSAVSPFLSRMYGI